MNSWKKEGIVYEIYVQSFNDSNNDGIGDIRGIIQKLDYLKGLGVNILWLTPIFESPLVDNGYDIADYRKINPQYGTMDDVDEMIEKAHEKGLKIVMDLVVNHTSMNILIIISGEIRKKTDPLRRITALHLADRPGNIVRKENSITCTFLQRNSLI